MSRYPRISAFTLVELLVAIAVSTILATLLATFCGSTLLIWQQETAFSERLNAAMTVFGQIRHDLRYAALPSDEPNAQFEMVINPATTWIIAGEVLPTAAFWQAPSATDRSAGENAIVGYFIQWNVTSTISTPKLCRLLINPSSAHYNLNTSPWVTPALLTSDAPATPATSYVGLIANNVLGLWMQPLDQNLNPITTTATGVTYASGVFDSRSGYNSTNGRTYPNALPASMLVSIVVMDSRTAQLLKGTEKPTPLSSYLTPQAFLASALLTAAQRKGARIYSTVINLVNAPQ